MSIATGTGDKGDSGLIGNVRVSKDVPRLHAYGTVDELNALLGIVRATGVSARIDSALEQLSRDLFALGSDLATPGADPERTLYLGADAVERLATWIRELEPTLPPLKSFILPGGSVAAAHLHHARTVCRRAERYVVTLHRETGEADVAIIFLNRLSDLLFLYARHENVEQGVADVEWHP